MEVIAAGASWMLNKAPSPQKMLGNIGLVSLAAWSDLSSKLSPNASITLPNDAGFGGLISRWRDWHAPQAGAVVTAFTEADVQETIRYANENGIPFLARSGGHGATEALQFAKDAIVVDIRGMNEVKLVEDGKSATISGGASVKKVVDTLWAAKKQTVTGICECVGLSAPILGGGHGWLQGQYGVASDQVISARVVLPNGEAVTASEDSNPDLFWGLRGAGHNFGIVTEWQYRIYDVKNPKWSYEVFIFLGDKLEEIFELTNKMMKNQPPHMTHWIYIVNIPEIDPDKPIIWYAIISDGTVEEAREYAKPLHDIGPINVNADAVPMPELAQVTLMGEDTVACAKGSTSLRYPIGLKSYNPPAVRKVYDSIAEISHRVPELAGSFFLLEGYSTQGVKAVDAAKSAFPHRDDEILITSVIQYKPNATLDALAQEHGRKLRGLLLEASDEPEHLLLVVNEIRHLEQLLGSIVNQLPAQQQGPSSDSPSIKSPASTYITHGSLQGSLQSSSGSGESTEVKPGRMMANPNETIYVSSSHWSAICNEVDSIREHLDETNESTDLGITDQAQSQVPMLLGSGRVQPSLDEILADMPPKHITDRLVSRYFTATEPSIMITHTGEFEIEYKRFWNDPHSVSVQWIGMLFGVLATGTFLYIRSQDDLPEGLGAPMEVAEGFHRRCTDCLFLSKYSTAPGKYTLETVLFNIHGEFVRRRDAHLGVWILTGIVVRLAMRMGYHRDPDNYPRISPFHGEMRRRVWGVIQQLDILTSCQLGLPSLIQESQCDTRLPRNITDDDFGPDSTRLPPPRPDTVMTPVLYTRVKVRMMTIYRTIFNQVSLGKTENYEEIMALDHKLHQMHQSMPPCFQIAKLEDCIMVAPYILIRRYNLELLFQKARCTLHRHHMTKAYQDPKYNYSRTACVDSAMTVLGHQASILKEVQVGGLLYKDRWFLTSLERHDFSLASMVVCLELSKPPEQQNPELVGYSREDMIQALKTSQVFWAALKAVSAEAKQAYDMLTVMLNAVSVNDKASTAAMEKIVSNEKAATQNGHVNVNMPDPSETPFSSEFQGLEAMLNNSEPVDWDMWESLVHMPDEFSNYEMSEEPQT
ncbi:uncharacterized protein FIESC28_10265 [Fusarium coffeatum]|uniref:FAD-binding PCMH-type domain-containing protein n=1 Tax=Fusarium coffeatum TaxID=231269 RepID=A0A366QWV0_9HYPO|nr:uncharacterized protein FIESC28_10265 [Fusarium coffeatum]RBR08465.1 hypothetical protein FIESC28_10265 [Fusarium coffeatum]